MKIIVKRAREVIKNFSKKYGLKYKPKWFQCIFLPYEECLIKKFLSGGPLGNYNFDKSEKRFKKLNEFIQSEFYKNMKRLKRGQGNLVTIKHFKIEKRNINKIGDSKLRNKVRFIYEKIEKKFKDEYLVILPKSGSYLLQILAHEWTHVLLNKNKVKRKKRGFDWLNEGLATFIEYLVNDKTDKIEKNMKKKGLSKTRYNYLKYALKWKKKLENSRERKRIIEKSFEMRKI